MAQVQGWRQTLCLNKGGNTGAAKDTTSVGNTLLGYHAEANNAEPSCWVLQVQGWCMTLCLNRARQRRQHRRHIEDWAHLLQHAMNADTSPPFADWLAASPLRWLAAEGPEADISVSGHGSNVRF